MKKKIGLFLSEEPYDGGKFQYGLSLLEAFDSFEEHKYEVVVYYKNGAWLEYLTDRRIKSVYLPTNYIDRFLCKLWEAMCFPPKWIRHFSPHISPLARTMLGFKRDLWIFPNHESLTYQIPIPSLATIHDLMHRYEPRFPEVSATGLYKKREWVYGNICLWSKAILVDSEVGKTQVVESYRIAPDKIYVLPYIAPSYIYLKPEASKFADRYHLPPKYIFYPAQFWEHKNHKGLVEAIASLKDRIPDLHLVFVGSSKNYFSTICRLVEKNELVNNISFLGYVPNEDMPELYRRARALIMPTFFGPTNIPPLEAIALGCPVAVSDIYGMKEQMGDAALYFNPSSHQDIASVIELLWRDDALCSELSMKGNERSRNWSQIQFNNSLHTICDLLLNL